MNKYKKYSIQKLFFDVSLHGITNGRFNDE